MAPRVARLLVVAGIAAGVTPVVATQVVNESLRVGLRDTVERLSGGAPLEVRLGFGELAFPQSLTAIVTARKGVSAAMPLVRGTVALADDPDETLELVGLDLAGKADLDRTQARLTGHRGDVRTWSSESQSIVLPTTLAQRYGVDLGGSIRLSTPQGLQTFTVRGLLEPEGFARAFGGRLAVTDLPVAQSALGKAERVDQIDVLLQPNADLAPLRDRLEAVLPQLLDVGSPDERAELYEAALRPFWMMLTGLSLLCLAAGAYLAYAAVSLAATSRAGELGVVAPMEALVLGATGAALGIVSGIALARPCVGPVLDALGTVFQLRFPFAELSLDPRRLIGVAVLGIAATVVATHVAGRAVASLQRLSRFPVRTASTVAAIALVTTVAVALASVLASRRASLGRYYEDGGLLAGDLVVSAITSGGGWLETPLAGELGAELRAIPGVRAVEMVRVLPGQLHRGRRITVLGLSNGLLDPARYGPRWYVEGDPGRAAAALRAGRGTNVAVGLAERFGLHLGDAMTLDTPAGPMRLPVVGIVRDYVSEGGTVVVSRNLVVELWDEPTVHRFALFLADDAPVEAVRRDLAERLRDRYRLKVLTPREVVDHDSRLLAHAFALAEVVQPLIVVVTFAALLDLLVAAVVTDARALGLLHSAGIGALGALLGTGLGLLTAGVAVRRLHLEYHVALAATAWYVTLVLGTAALAGRLAARRARDAAAPDAMRR